ncbi:hypothetical protein ILUMI_12546 [Ignelater luminosus]|uniref:Mos1 transposase HTH domain-containing protein n=1 Tax=Ignelater luminosus TaxID=2038154 RepID=A0A8K0CU06_IGNLU|nr:hypothetical protein ILUMI_12546 [Ignelater luminosus]
MLDAQKVRKKLKNVYGDECLSQARVYEWAGRFKAGRESKEDNKRQGVLVTVHTDYNIEHLRALVAANCWLTIRRLSVELGIKETVCQMLHDNLSGFPERVQKEGREWLSTVITGDES